MHIERQNLVFWMTSVTCYMFLKNCHYQQQTTKYQVEKIIWDTSFLEPAINVTRVTGGLFVSLLLTGNVSHWGNYLLVTTHSNVSHCRISLLVTTHSNVSHCRISLLVTTHSNVSHWGNYLLVTTLGYVSHWGIAFLLLLTVTWVTGGLTLYSYYSR